MTWRLQRLHSAPPDGAFAARVAAVVLALATAALVLLVSGHSPVALGAQVFGSSFGIENLGLLLTPLIYTGLSVAVALRNGAWNLGAEGQFNMGALFASGVTLYVPLPGVVLLPLLGGGGGAGRCRVDRVPTLARAYADVSELITTLRLNFVALLAVYYLATGPWLDLSGRALATTARPPVSVREFWRIVHWGSPVAVVLAGGLTVLFAVTRWGYQVRVGGSNPGAARYAGMPVRVHLISVMLLSGAIASIGGMTEVAGKVNRLQGGNSNNYGHLGITVAVLARGAPLGVPASAFRMAMILNGGIILQTQGITTQTVLAMTGLILLYAAIGDLAAQHRLIRTKAKDG